MFRRWTISLGTVWIIWAWSSTNASWVLTAGVSWQWSSDWNMVWSMSTGVAVWVVWTSSYERWKNKHIFIQFNFNEFVIFFYQTLSKASIQLRWFYCFYLGLHRLDICHHLVRWCRWWRSCEQLENRSDRHSFHHPSDCRLGLIGKHTNGHHSMLGLHDMRLHVELLVLEQFHATMSCHKLGSLFHQKRNQN